MSEQADKDVETIELDEKALTEITAKTAEAVMPQVEEAVKSAVEESNKELGDKLDAFIAKTENTDKVDLTKEADADADDKLDAVAKGIKDGTIKQEIADLSPAVRMYKGVQALMNEDMGMLKQINRYNIASQKAARAKLGQEEVAKTGYANETTAADGAVLVPDAEFVTTVFENLPQYGVAFADADVRQTDRTAVRVISLDSGLTFYATAEAGVKTSAKLQFSKNEVSLQKYAVIVPATDELTDDAAIDYWNVVTKELTRAYAKVADEITFTNATTGITNLSGVITEQTSGAGTTVDWGDLLSAEGKVEDGLDTSNFKWYMRKETWFRLIALKGTTNDHYLAGSLNTNGWVANPNTPTTPWGTPVVFTRVLPSSGPTAGSPGAVGNNDAFAVYGDLRNYILYNKRGMALKMLTEATILDADSVSTNLATQDISAMRAVIRLLGILPKGNRSKFVILGTGTVS